MYLTDLWGIIFSLNQLAKVPVFQTAVKSTGFSR
jgi:hypothetical protein